MTPEQQSEFDRLTTLVGSEVTLTSTLADLDAELSGVTDHFVSLHVKRRELVNGLAEVAAAKVALVELKNAAE